MKTTKPLSLKRIAEKASDNVSLKAICTELKLDPRLAREKLRIAVREVKRFPDLAKSHKPRSAWEWTRGSKAELQARDVLGPPA